MTVFVGFILEKGNVFNRDLSWTIQQLQAAGILDKIVSSYTTRIPGKGIICTSK